MHGIHMRSRKDVELEVVLQGTNLESILKWASGSEDKLMRIHLCGAKCPAPLEAENYLHGEFIRARTGEDLPWMMNLVAEVREEKQELPAQPPAEKGRKEEKKKKKEKDRGRSKEKDRSRKRRRRKSSGTRSRSSATRSRSSVGRKMVIAGFVPCYRSLPAATSVDPGLRVLSGHRAWSCECTLFKGLVPRAVSEEN